MVAKFFRKKARSFKRRLKNKRVLLLIVLLLLCAGSIGYAMYLDNRRLVIDPASYAPLLHLIGKAESNDNYNAYFGNAGNTSIDFTNMSIADVLAWQANHVAQGNASSAVGRYQIIDTTLSGLVQRLGIDTKTKFDQKTQDTFAIALLERRGSVKYINEELTLDQFAANLAMEWAALPKVIGDKPGDSYYAADGLNKSRVSVDEVRKAIEPISPR